MLGLKPAFDETDRPRLIKQVTTDEPERLSRLNPAIPRDLVTIVHKAIDREPSRRYQTAREFADDLERFLADEPSWLAAAARWNGRCVGSAAGRPRPLWWASAPWRRWPSRRRSSYCSTAANWNGPNVKRSKRRVEAEHSRDAEASQREVAEAARHEAERQRRMADGARHEAEKEREQAILQRGLLAVHTGQWKDAADDLDRYTRSHPNAKDAWLGLADAQAGLGLPQKAAAAYGKVIGLEQDNIAARLGRAEQELAQGDYAGAISDYSHAYKLDPDQFEDTAGFARALDERSAGWQVLHPSKLAGAGGITLKALEDGSIVPGTVNGGTRDARSSPAARAIARSSPGPTWPASGQFGWKQSRIADRYWPGLAPGVVAGLVARVVASLVGQVVGTSLLSHSICQSSAPPPQGRMVERMP